MILKVTNDIWLWVELQILNYTHKRAPKLQLFE